jgi:hypothetical protein
LAEGEEGLLGDGRGGIDDVRRRVVDPLDMKRVVGGKVIAGEGDDIGGVEVVHTTDVYAIRLRFVQRILVVYCGDECVGAGSR